ASNRQQGPQSRKVHLARTGMPMNSAFAGFDHIDTRVANLAAVEPFYDRLRPALGLPNKRYANVDARGEWHEGTESDHNTVEYIEEGMQHIIGFIEDARLTANDTRIAFKVASLSELAEWEGRLREMGAANVEPCDDMQNYPAIFFEDPGGTKLELV